MTNGIRNRLTLLVLILTLVLLGMVGLKQFTLSTGTIVELETAPIDPRSLFRGDFARLNFKIGQLSGTDYVSGFKQGDTVFVLLDARNTPASFISLHGDWPDAVPGQVVMKGRVSRVLRDSMWVRYGIENFFVPEGEGIELERRDPDRTITVEVAVDRFGKSAIKTLLVDGEPYHSETFF